MWAQGFEETAWTWNTPNQEHPRGASHVISVICVHLIQHSLCFHGRGTDSSSSTPLWKNHFCSNTDTFFVCYLKVRLSLLKKKQEVRLSSWKQLSLYQLNHWCSPAPLTALSPFAKPACAGGALVCVALSSWPWTSHHPQPQGWEPWMGSWLLGWAPQLPCPSTNTSTRNHLLSAKCKICSLLLSGRRNLKLLQMFKHTSLLNYSVYSACSWS